MSMNPLTRQRPGKPIGFELVLTIIFFALSGATNVFSQSSSVTTFIAHDVECTLYKVEDDTPRGDSNFWACGDMETYGDPRFSSLSLATINSDVTDIQADIDFMGAESGASKLILSEVEANYETSSLHIPGHANIQIEHIVEHERRLAKKKGTLKSLVVRVLDSTGRGSDVTRDELYKYAFNHPEGHSAAQQFRACSYGRLKILPYGNSKESGVIDLRVDHKVVTKKTERSTIANLALEEVRKFDYYDDLDLIQICLPHGTIGVDNATDWAGYAVVNGIYSVVNDHMCHSVSAWMHEIGHDISLGHSNSQIENEDNTDLMGPSYDEKYGFKAQCFNAAKNFQLGWYPRMQMKVNPLAFQAPSHSKTYTMVGVDDYKPRAKNKDRLVGLQLGNTFFIGYNRKKGINDGVQQHSDQIIVFKKQGKGGSTIQASLGLKDSYTIENYASGRNVTIKVTNINHNTNTAGIEIFDDKFAPVNDEVDDKISEGPCDPAKFYEFTMEILGDTYPEDISWTLSDPDKGVVLHQTNYTAKFNNNPAEIRTFCLPFGKDYTFTIYDANNDGICCKSYGNGYYKGIGPNGEILFAGGYEAPGEKVGYESSESHQFPTPGNLGINEVTSCIDDPNFRLDLATQNCAWIKRNKSGSVLSDFCKTKSERDGNKTIGELCPSACLTRGCCKNQAGVFRINGRKTNCGKVGTRSCNSKTDNGRSKRKGATVRNRCPVKCKVSSC